MSDPDISPLAKRLAEENNVDWRSLEGSGEDGRIVERDVLEYLARVMAGEEDLNPTPEPLPEGLDAWPEEDVQAEAPVQDEASVALAESSDEEMLLDDDFMLEDEMLENRVSQAAPSTPDMQNDPSVYETQISEDIFLLDDDTEIEETGPADERMQAEVTEETDEMFTEMPVAAEVEPTQPEEVMVAEEFVDDKDDTLWDESTPSTLIESEGFASDTPELFGEMDAAPEHVEVFETEAELDAVAQEGTLDAEVLEPAASPAAEVPAQEVDLGDMDEMDEVAPVALDVGQLPLVSHGVLLRRHVDLTALADAQLAVGRELGDDHPVSPTAFIVRAAARAFEGEGDVALALISDRGVGTAGFAKAHTSAFRELLAQVAELEAAAHPEQDAAGLIIADMSAYDIDEAVLNLDAPVLTLGRILYDNTEGRYQSTLSLSGDISADAGAKLLERVAKLLASPVQLVL